MPKSKTDNEKHTINEIEYRVAEVFSALYSLKELLKEENINDEIITTIYNGFDNDFNSLTNYLTEKGHLNYGKK